MALQTTDALNRTFADLKSKSEDVKSRAAFDLFRLVAAASRGMLSHKSRFFELTKLQSYLPTSFKTTILM